MAAFQQPVLAAKKNIVTLIVVSRSKNIIPTYFKIPAIILFT